MFEYILEGGRELAERQALAAVDRCGDLLRLAQACFVEVGDA